jgi:predicted MFS family arabinose efflux permease
LIGGVIAQNYGWRVALYALGIPGILYAVLVWFTVKEPIKGRMDKVTTNEKEYSFKEVVSILLQKKTFIFLSLATGFQSFGNYAIGNWLAPFLGRTHGMDLATIGITLGLIAAFGGGLGTFMGGYLTDKMAKKDIRWYFWLPALAIVINMPLAIFVFFGENVQAILGVLVVSYFLSALYLGPAIAVTHNLVSAKMRAFSSAVLFFVLNTIGLGFGPLVIGMLSDWLEPTYGTDALRWAFTCTFITGLIAAVFLYMAASHYKKDLNEKMIFEKENG